MRGRNWFNGILGLRGERKGKEGVLRRRGEMEGSGGGRRGFWRFCDLLSGGVLVREVR